MSKEVKNLKTKDSSIKKDTIKKNVVKKDTVKKEKKTVEKSNAKSVDKKTIKKVDKKVDSKSEKTVDKKSITKTKKKADKKVIDFKNKKTIVVVMVAVLFFALAIFCFLNLDDKSNTSDKLSGEILGTELNSDSKVLAVANGKDILESDLNRNIYISLYSQGADESVVENIPRGQLLNQTILFSILFDKAIEGGFVVDREEVIDSFNTNLIQSGQSLDVFKVSLVNKSFTFDELVDFYVVQRTIMLYVDDMASSKVEVSDEEILNFYNSNSQYFNKAGQIKASHILLETEDKANEVIEMLDNGDDFAKLAKEFSTGPSGPNGGDLGFFGKGAMVAEFEAAAFDLENVDDYTSKPVKTQFGFHVIKLTGRTDAEVIGLDEVKDKIREQLVSEKKSVVINDLTNEVMATSEIKIN